MRSAAAKQATHLHFQLPPLPYAEDALAPVISAETLKLHHGKHHKKYIDTMNQLLEKEPVRPRPWKTWCARPRASCSTTPRRPGTTTSTGIRSRRAPAAGRRAAAPRGKGFRQLRQVRRRVLQGGASASSAAAGPGWSKRQDGKLEVMATGNADTPMAHGIRCLLTVDVWEHAYYVDYRNERERYVSAILDRLNWEFAEKNLR
jgi:Fe-Mn family superoxide dismutase